jgi:Fe2+ transport system protein FeoA
MFEEKCASYRIGKTYRIGKLLSLRREDRNMMVSLGLIPGESIQIMQSLFWGRYWVIRVRKQLIGLRLSELQRLQLHDIYS